MDTPESETIGILRLPNEILIQILQFHPADSGIFALSTSCRRLHYLALPVYLAAHGIPDTSALASQDLVLLPNQLDTVLVALQTALFIPSLKLKHISCAFALDSASIQYSFIPIRTRRDLFFRHLRRLAGFLSKLEQVDEVTLDFRDVGFALFSQGLGALDTWDSIISALLDASLETGCKTFTVEGGMFLVHSSQFQRNSSSFRTAVVIKRRSSLMSDLGRRIASAFVRRPDTIQRGIGSGDSESQPQPGGLRTFNIHSNVLLLRPCYSWTMATLRASPNLVSLSIVCADIPRRNGDDILANIHAPGLKYFVMDLDCQVSEAALDQFRARHRHIGPSSFGVQVSFGKR
ncbi:hypothetical protein MVEN_00974000 [Mycena venus]|uniref:F-box domain-containing protein n=1 Tax=Mycena venus TaxID=2733690 RepID=A0A8H7D1X2_9AGAR|nr:hypothetical protein MVEN_00974000 [Mycena venus]